MRKLAPSYVANFDSASTFLRATARFLKDKDFPALGIGSGLKAVVPLANLLPWRLREGLYAAGGAGEALGPGGTDRVRSADLAQWATGLYPDRSYPAVMIGSSSGALVHLCAALGLPWLPQTLFVPVRQTDVHPDDARHGLEAGIEPGRRLLEANPDLQLHHMHDPNQDRLMLHLMTYFRVKRRRLGDDYERFLRERLRPGGTIILVECERRWPVTRVGDRHVFQFGALGGAAPEEFQHGSARVADYLARYRSHRRRWDPPAPTEDAPEAEWGFEPALRDDVEDFARRHGFRVVRLVFQEPEDLSPLVADLYRWWYAQRGIVANRLLVQSFLLVAPWWTLRTGSVPYWMKFNMDPSADSLERYLDQVAPFDQIHINLFSHGVECVGLTPLARWRAILERGRRGGTFAGVEESKYPRDFAVFSRYHAALREIPARYPMPGPLSLEQLAAFLLQSDPDRYRVAWHGLDAAISGAGLRSSGRLAWQPTALADAAGQGSPPDRHFGHGRAAH